MRNSFLLSDEGTPISWKHNRSHSHKVPSYLLSAFKVQTKVTEKRERERQR